MHYNFSQVLFFVSCSAIALETLATPDSPERFVWKDELTGTQWSGVADGSSDYEKTHGITNGQMKMAQAIEYCSSLGMILPTIDDFKAAEAHGIRNVILDFQQGPKNYFDGRWFMSSSLDIGGRYGDAFNGYDGSIYPLLKTYPFFIRCIDRDF